MKCSFSAKEGKWLWIYMRLQSDVSVTMSILLTLLCH